MVSIPCTVCGTAIPGVPDADVTCADCEQTNFGGDPLRKPPRQQRQGTPQPWWQRERLPLVPRRDGLRVLIDGVRPDTLRDLRFHDGPWTWSEENGIEERTDV